MKDLIASMLESNDPSVRLKTELRVLGRDSESKEMQKLAQEVKESERVRLLLSERTESGTIPGHPYAKWYGAHWVLSDLADIGYPPGDKTLHPMRDQSYRWLLSKEHARGIRIIQGRVRRCASQEGNAVYYSLALGIADSRTDELAERLMMWQWPDGGWNCDKKPEASNSSFMESLIPLRALALYAARTGSEKAQAVTDRAADIFLKRHLFKKISDGEIIADDFVKLHYPCYWHYDILFALKVMAEAGYATDSRCGDALDLLESKKLPDGGFPAEGKYYRVTDKKTSGRSLVAWGGSSKKKTNEFVTADALFVLKEAGRLD
jgi:hypothetical protein